MILLAMFLYLIRMVAIGIAMGIVFIKFDLFQKMKDWEVMTIGVCAAPLFAGLMNYWIGLGFVNWPSWFFYVIPLTFAVAWSIYGNNYKLLLPILKDGKAYMKNYLAFLGNWVVVDIAFLFAALTIFVARFDGYGLGFKEAFSGYPHLIKILRLDAVVLGGGVIFYIWKRVKDEKRRKQFLRHFFFVASMIILGSSILFGGLHNLRPVIDNDHSHYELNARYFMEDRNSWNIDDYTDARYGSSLRDDHGPLWIMVLVDPCIAGDVAGVDNPLRISNLNLSLVYFCFNILLFLTAAHIAGTPKAGVAAILLFGLYLEEKYMILSWRDAFRFDGLLVLFLYVGNNFFSFVKGNVKFFRYFFLALFCYLAMNGHAGNAYIMLGMFLLVMVVLFIFHTPKKEMFLCGMAALLGTLAGITKTISIYIETGRLRSTAFLPFHDTAVEEYMRNYHAAKAVWGKIWETYTGPVMFMMALGAIGLLLMIIIAWRRKKQTLFVWGCLMLGMLLPLTGIMDWIGYKCSLWFFYQGRYRMYFLMIFAITGSWLLFYSWRNKVMKELCVLMTIMIFGGWGYVEYDKYNTYSQKEADLFQTQERQYKNIADRVAELSSGDAFVWRQPKLYYLHGTPKLLFHMYSESLIQAKTEQEIKQALHDLHVGTIILPSGGFIYNMLPFWDYINEEFICVSSTEFGNCVIFVNPEFMKDGVF